MIVRILSSGKSFKGLTEYLTHDPEAKTAERVAWTHTLNLANDHVPSAVDEMLWTSRNAELLKQEAGIRAGGRATENAVKHLSLNWHPEDNPTREHMLEATEAFLRHMNWHEHQAILVAHDDKLHRHVHVELNVVHPETGLRLNDDFERRRAQEWALEYERENGRIHCEQRLKNVEEREDSPTRPAWTAFQNKAVEFEREEKSLRDNQPILLDDDKNPKITTENSEWKKLKEIQRHERELFYANGAAEFKNLRNSIYQEVREDFRDRWAGLFEAQRDGGDAEALAAMKAELVAEQTKVLEERRDEACKELRQDRNDRYHDILRDQKEARHDLRWRQEAGLDNAPFLQQVEENSIRPDLAVGFRDAANTATGTPNSDEHISELEHASRDKDGRAGVRSGLDIGAGIGESVGVGLISFLESIADGFLGSSKPDPKPRQREAERSGPNPFEIAAEDARRQQERDRERADRDDWYKKQRSLSGD